ncbi:LacI family DNA-binding transcriptional regulator [Paenibacillus ginsengarvi]|uniref:LacI family DNA-binding transcriptional regulator n=1 Tax=Paenibacillus ginsengarvi TaxID=400777 RepID=UPI0011C3DF4D|nr:LacI family DNA-binding transcriptional regulator [Paenibacillus ginsengarvi]
MSKLLEVAKLAGVSKATVSRVINNSDAVSPQAKQKVLEAMETLKFQSHNLKRAPESSSMLGVVLPFGKHIWSHSFGIDILAGAEEKAFDHDYMILIGNSNGGRETALTANMTSRGVEGLIVQSAERGQAEHLRYVQSLGVPLVLVDQKVEGLQSHLVRGDNFSGAVTLMTHLFEHGHTRIGLVSPNKHFTYKERMKGYRFALLDRGIWMPESYEALGGDESLAAQLNRMLMQNEPPTALFVASTGMLREIIDVLGEHNLRVPEHISIVTFDEHYSIVPEGYQEFFTSINQSGKLMGSMAVELLFQQLRNPAMEPQEIVLPGRFTERRSVRRL